MSSQNEAGGDDDLFVVIIGDEEETGQELQNEDVYIKEEILDDDSDMGVEYLLETAEKHGQLIDINNLKTEPEFTEVEFADDRDYEYQDEDVEVFVPDQYADTDEDSDDDNEFIPKIRVRKSLTKEPLRAKMRPPEKQVSFIKEIRRKHPEVREDKDKLIEIVARYMMNVRRPDPPQDYFVMNYDKFECVMCGALTDTIPAASRHYREKHGPRYLICFACGVDFRSTTNLYKHEKACSAPDAVTVLKARARTLGRKGRSRPFLLSPEAIKKLKPKPPRPGKRFQCSLCDACYCSQQSLNAHERRHAGERPYRCEHCPAAYTTAAGLSRHTSATHSGETFICDQCSRPFKTKVSLTAHFETHKPLRRFECVECGRRYAQKMALQLHIDRDHRHLPPPCACPLCPRRYPRNSLLRAHMRRQHGMDLITKKMFYNCMPMKRTVDTQLSLAKVVLKTEVPDECDGRPDHPDSGADHPDSGADHPDDQTDHPDDSEDHTDLSQELGEIMQDSTTQYVVVRDGRTICVVGTDAIKYSAELESCVGDEEADDKENLREQLRALAGAGEGETEGGAGEGEGAVEEEEGAAEEVEGGVEARTVPIKIKPALLRKTQTSKKVRLRK